MGESGETPVPRLKQKVIQVTHTVETKIRSRPRRRKNIKPDTPKSGRKRTHSSRLVLPMFLKRSTSSTAVVAIQISRVRKEASMMLPNTQVKTPLEARAVGARLSAFGAKRASLFLLKRGWNVCMSKHVYKLKWPCQRITLFSLSIALSVLRV